MKHFDEPAIEVIMFSVYEGVMMDVSGNIDLDDGNEIPF